MSCSGSRVYMNFMWISVYENAKVPQIVLLFSPLVTNYVTMFQEEWLLIPSSLGIYNEGIYLLFKRY